jgi:hypothetical protein
LIAIGEEVADEVTHANLHDREEQILLAIAVDILDQEGGREPVVLEARVRLWRQATGAIEIHRAQQATVGDPSGHFGQDEIGASIRVKVFDQRGDLDQAQGAFLLRAQTEVVRLRWLLRKLAGGVLEIHGQMILPGSDQVGAPIPVKIQHTQLREAIDQLQGVIPNLAEVPLAPEQERRL